jgi:hypothetical protein
MDGIEILSVIEEPVLLFNEGAFGSTFFITVVISLFIAVYLSITENEWFYFPLFSIIGVLAGVLLGLIAGGLFVQKTDEVEITYKVTISEEVSLNDFMEKYEIIDQEDKIYTIREKEE